MQRVDMRLLRRDFAGNALLSYILRINAHGQALVEGTGFEQVGNADLITAERALKHTLVDSPSRHLMANISSIETSSFAQGLSTLSMSSKPVHAHTHVAQNGALGRTERRSELEGVRAVAPPSASRPLAPADHYCIF